MRKIYNRVLGSAVVFLTAAWALSACGGDFSCADSLSCDGGAMGGERATDDAMVAEPGGMGGKSAVPAVEEAFPIIVTMALSDGRVNVEYTEQLQAKGEGKLTFSVGDGELPKGLELSSEGLLSGIPLIEGVFSLSVTVTNEDGKSKTVTLSLTIVQKRWLAFVLQEDGAERLKVLDYSKNSLPQWMVSTGMGADSDIKGGADGSFGFADNGNKLAYLADKGTDGIYGLYVVDTSGKEVVGDKKVSGAGTVTSFAWAPNGNRIAFIEGDDVFIHDLKADKTYNPGQGDSQLVWFDDDLLTYSAKDGASTVGFTRFVDGKFSSASEVTSGSLYNSRLQSKVGGVGYFVGAGAGIGPADMLIDFDNDAELTPLSTEWGGFAYLSPDFDHVVNAGGNTSFYLQLFKMSEPDTELISIPSGLNQARWTPDSRWFCFMGSDDGLLKFVDPTTLQVFNTGSSVESKFLRGEPYWGNFSSDERWLVFPTGSRKLAAIPVGGETPGASIEISSQELVFQSTFSPSGKLLAFVEYSSDSLKEYHLAIQLVDMSGNAPRDLRRISTKRSNNGKIDFSSDSAAFGYIGESPVDLYVTNVVDKDSVAKAATNLCSGSNCEDKVLSFVFQP